MSYLVLFDIFSSCTHSSLLTGENVLSTTPAAIFLWSAPSTRYGLLIGTGLTKLEEFF